ncbi:hypothetical protein [Methylosinus sp. Sm6]|uniref:hypothetical protein n=1 Tax=Methylosinus sp. Sm6 TaxID=2866948 RepID=UPI001C9947CE|nr:hypothetical protein [Methylosinus sp. Sm6]MBY6243185.1 hypothetical protein [Methylosinus sp. Sm6]
MTFLRGAAHLVFGFGTFGRGVCLLAGPIQTMDVFDSSYEGFPNVRELTVLTPRPGAYIATGEWRRTPEQLRLMLDFPEEDLERRRRPNKKSD